MADLACGAQVLERAHRFGERHPAPPVQQVKIDAVGAQPPEASLAGLRHAGARGVGRQHLAHQEHLIAPPGDRIGHDLLGAAIAIHLGRIDQRHAKVEPQLQRICLLDPAARVLAHAPCSLSENRQRFPARQRRGFHGHAILRCRFGGSVAAFRPAAQTGHAQQKGPSLSRTGPGRCMATGARRRATSRDERPAIPASA